MSGLRGRSAERDRREADLDGRRHAAQIVGTPPPQSRPARTLVLIFMVSSSVASGGWGESTQRDRREADLDGRRHVAQIVGTPPPQSRPARTLVLIFMIGSCVLRLMCNAACGTARCGGEQEPDTEGRAGFAA